MGRAYTTFKYSLMKMGGIWEDTDNVYFSQFLPSVSIIYAPKYPEYTDKDVEVIIDNAMLKYPTYTVRLGNCSKDTVIVKKFGVWKEVEDFLNEHPEFTKVETSEKTNLPKDWDYKKTNNLIC